MVASNKGTVMKQLLFISFLAISGCASVNGMRERSPDIVLTTHKSPDTYGKCVAVAWGTHMSSKVNQGPLGNGGYTVNLLSYEAGSDAVLDAMPDGSGTVAKIWYRKSWLIGRKSFSKDAYDCE